jgi:hypothetical protein
MKGEVFETVSQWICGNVQSQSIEVLVTDTTSNQTQIMEFSSKGTAIEALDVTMRQLNRCISHQTILEKGNKIFSFVAIDLATSLKENHELLLAQFEYTKHILPESPFDNTRNDIYSEELKDLEVRCDLAYIAGFMEARGSFDAEGPEVSITQKNNFILLQIAKVIGGNILISYNPVPKNYTACFYGKDAIRFAEAIYPFVKTSHIADQLKGLCPLGTPLRKPRLGTPLRT